MYVSQISMVYAINICIAVCQLYLNKTGGKTKVGLKHVLGGGAGVFFFSLPRLKNQWFPAGDNFIPQCQETFWSSQLEREGI